MQKHLQDNQIQLQNLTKLSSTERIKSATLLSVVPKISINTFINNNWKGLNNKQQLKQD